MKPIITLKQLLLFICLTAFFSCKVSKNTTNNSEVTQTPKAMEVLKITEKVADWQIETFEEMGVYRALPSRTKDEPWRHRKKHSELAWTTAALYAGMFELTKVSDQQKYIDWLFKIGDRNNWKHKTRRYYHADDHAVGQLYLSLKQNERLKNKVSIQPTKTQFDSIMKGEKGQEYHWDWCDALFMAPPAWTRLAKVTKDNTYLEYMDTQYKMTYDELWDTEEQLFFRDKKFIKRKEKNGEKLFWSRGNGWVFGGIALMLPDFPENWEGKAFYEKIFVQMAETIKKTQREDGTWSSGVLGDVKDYPTVETSGSSFFTFGLAWGINNGLLDKETYEPVLFKAWDALVNCVDDKGMLGYVQPIGAAPGESFKDYTEVYGIGAFLAAGSELYSYLNK